LPLGFGAGNQRCYQVGGMAAPTATFCNFAGDILAQDFANHLVQAVVPALFFERISIFTMRPMHALVIERAEGIAAVVIPAQIIPVEENQIAPLASTMGMQLQPYQSEGLSGSAFQE
jgi:hypothetical protein